MASEADLDADIKALSILSEHPELYGEFAQLGSVNSLIGLLSHENTDIVIDTIQIISELTDDDVEANEEQWNTLVDAMVGADTSREALADSPKLDADVLELLSQNFARLDESNESDRNGIYHSLSRLSQ